MFLVFSAFANQQIPPSGSFQAYESTPAPRVTAGRLSDPASLGRMLHLPIGTSCHNILALHCLSAGCVDSPCYHLGCTWATLGLACPRGNLFKRAGCFLWGFYEWRSASFYCNSLHWEKRSSLSEGYWVRAMNVQERGVCMMEATERKVLCVVQPGCRTLEGFAHEWDSI